MTYTEANFGYQDARFTQIKTATEACEWYRWYIKESGLDERIRLELRGKDVMCFCGLDQPCHGDILLEAANA